MQRSILGFTLGAPLADAVKAAPAGLTWHPDTGPYRRAQGRFEGMSLTAQLTEKAGRLADLQISLTDAPATPLAQSAAFTALKAALGAPSQLTTDEARWTDGAWTVELTRLEIFEKGDDDAQLEYGVRARLAAPPIPSGPDPDAAAKQRELDAARGK